jgi:WD40 repeat protein
MCLARDGKVLATGGDDGVRVWNTETWQVICRIDSVWPLIALSPDGQTVVAGVKKKDRNSGAIEIWNVAKSERIAEISAHQSGSTRPYMHYTKGAFSPNGNLLATAGRLDSKLKTWDTSDWTEKSVLGRAISATALSFSRRKLACGF